MLSVYPLYIHMVDGEINDEELLGPEVDTGST